MCYDIKTSLEAQLKRARDKGDLMAIDEILEKLIPLTDLPIYHASGFTHPDILIYTDHSPFYPKVATWGLIPHWVKDKAQSKKIWNNTLNARGETIFEKPAFREAALHNRCIVYIDGFYEHHHFKDNIYPFFIQHKDKTPLALAGLWSEWQDPEMGGIITSFTIVTTEANDLLTKIHNNPKLKGARMPLILNEKNVEIWLKSTNDSYHNSQMHSLISGYPSRLLEAYTVNKLRGKLYPGNVKEISQYKNYTELDY